MDISTGKIGIIYKSGHTEAEELLSAVIERFDLQARTWVCSTGDVDPDMPEAKGTGVIVTFGGDGTIIRAARVAVPNEIPILGVNMGRLGFMTELKANEVLDKLPQYLEAAARVEERSMLRVEILSGRKRNSLDSSSNGDGPAYHALNDAVVGRGAASRVVRIGAFIDGAHLTDFRADAVMVATATGSTGYNLSVGGPILSPQAGEIILKSVAPHVGMAPALVLPASSVIDLVVETDHQAMLSVDGFEDIELSTGAYVRVESSPFRARFLRANPRSEFYSTLTRRLGFGGGQSTTRAIQY